MERDLNGVNLPPVFSTDGKVLAVSEERTQLTLFSLPGMNPFAKLSDGAWISSVAFSEDSRQITAAGHSRTVTWKVGPRQEEIARTDMPLSIGAVIRPGHGRALYSSHDMTALQLLGKNGLSQPWDIPAGRYLTSMQLSPDGSTALTAFNDNTVALWDTDTAQLRHLEFSRDSALVCLARSGSGYEVWDWRAAKRLLHIPSMGGNMQGAALSPDRRTAAVSIADRPIAVYDVRGESSVLRTEVSVFNARSLTFSPDGKRLAVGSENGGITVLNSDSLLPVLTLRANYFPVFSVRFTADGTAPRQSPPRYSLGGAATRKTASSQPPRALPSALCPLRPFSGVAGSGRLLKDREAAPETVAGGCFSE